MGEVSGREKDDLIGRAGAVLFPSPWEEPFGLVLAEAAARGTPVVSLARGSAPELIVDGVTGVLCADEEEMARAIPRAMALDPGGLPGARGGAFRPRPDRSAVPGNLRADSCGGQDSEEDDPIDAPGKALACRGKDPFGGTCWGGHNPAPAGHASRAEDGRSGLDIEPPLSPRLLSSEDTSER